VAEDAEMNAVLNELLSEAGSEIYLRDCRFYCPEGGKATYWDIMQRARSRGEIAMGFANLQDRTQTTCTLNPENKDEERVWPTGTVIVVLSSD
jgi:hypothetical protein